ncbi:hydroxyisourate hydrolase [Edaphobacter aggregans]|uniref:hydroxyisourate hydrolase n=1 Tax=Edaphobacter aggregans TaxID=570835 RepID=UPI001FDFFEB3|nr:hydroxyisourate hydrolase [Edaphobacter aggregans]
MKGISTHVLDTALGTAAAAVSVVLERAGEDGGWQSLSAQQTDSDGRCRQLLPEDVSLQPGQYRLRFDTGAYYKTKSIEGLYPFVEVTFVVRESDTHLHIPLLLTANGYTTYRGT